MMSINKISYMSREKKKFMLGNMSRFMVQSSAIAQPTHISHTGYHTAHAQPPHRDGYSCVHIQDVDIKPVQPLSFIKS